MGYQLIIEATTARFRAEYEPYDTRPEFDEGMQAYEAALADPTRSLDCPYDGPGHAGYKALAWGQGLECAVRLRFWFARSRKLPVFGRAAA